MRLFVGLGNPGKKYEKTRHNIGWMVLEALAPKITNQIPNPKFQFENKFNADILKTKDAILAKPQTFMNDSGDAVSAIANFYKIEPDNIYVIHDDLDIKLGEYKIQKGKGPKQHNGILSIEEKLGRNDFWRVRIGIENREVGNKQSLPLRGRISGEVYTLQEFGEEEITTIKNVIDKVLKELI